MRRTASDRDCTKGSVVRNLLSLSWPMMMSQSLYMIGPTIDMIWVGKLGSTPLAGVGVSGLAVGLINGMMTGLFTGLRAMIARFIGAGDARGANHVMQQALVIGAVFSIFTAAIGIFLAEPILILVGVEADVFAVGAAYMRIQLVGMVTLSLLRITGASMQASGDTVTPMRIAIFSRLFHLVLVPFLILGWWIFPRLGVSGAALANVFSQGLGGAIGLWFLFSGRTRLRLTLRNFRLDRNIIWRLAKVGIPDSITNMQRTFPHLAMVWFVAPFGTLAVAAYSLTTRVDAFMRTFAASLGQSSGVLTGQNLGAGRPERAEKTGWLAAGLFTGIMAIVSLAIWFWAEHIVRVFNAEPGLVEIASTFLRIQIVSYMVFGTVIVLSWSIEGVGDTMPPMLVTLLTMWLVQVPLAYFLPRVTDLGVYGVRWAIVSGWVVGAIAYSIYFKTGRWKRKLV